MKNSLFIIFILTLFGVFPFPSNATDWPAEIVENGQVGNGYTHGQYPSKPGWTHVGVDIGSTCGAVIFIHHGTKAEGTTPRGHSVFNGALDMALHLKAKDGHGVIRGKLTKNRNGSVDCDIAIRIGTHELGKDQDGDVIDAAYAIELAQGNRQPVSSFPWQRWLRKNYDCFVA